MSITINLTLVSVLLILFSVVCMAGVCFQLGRKYQHNTPSDLRGIADTNLATEE